MRQKTKKTWLYPALIGGMFLTLAAGPAVAGHHGRMGGQEEMCGGGMMCGPLCGPELDLTADQQEKIKADQVGAQKEMIKLEAEAKTLHVDLAAESGKDKPDMSVIEKLCRRIGEIKGRMILTHTQSRLKVRSLLTPEQRKKMDERMMECGPGKRGCPGVEGKCPGAKGRKPPAEKADK